MDILKRIVFYVLVLLAVSCGSKKKLTTVDIQKEKIEFSSPKQRELIISNLCDSITGLPIQFDEKVEKNGVTSGIKTLGNSLIINTTQLDTVIKYEYIYRDKFVDREVVRNKVDWRVILFFCATILILILFPKIPRAINTIVKKLIGIPV